MIIGVKMTIKSSSKNSDIDSENGKDNLTFYVLQN